MVFHKDFNPKTTAIPRERFEIIKKFLFFQIHLFGVKDILITVCFSSENSVPGRTSVSSMAKCFL